MLVIPASQAARVLAAAWGLSLLVTACGRDGGATPSPSPTRTVAPSASESTPQPSGSSPSGSTDLRDVHVQLQPVATLDSAVALAVRTGDDALYVAEIDGRVVALRGGNPETVLDIVDQVSTGGERGLLGIAFSPDGLFLYVNYTDLDGNTQVVEYPFQGGLADERAGRRVIAIDQPFGNHNGGNLVFGPDGFLYIGMGDGGSQGDPFGNGQNLGALLAKMLRIDPRPSGDAPYRIPPDNPFVGRRGARGEVWALGLRNPWRYSFDRETGDLWIADVGGSDREEIDVEPAGVEGGRNYGWNLMEGTVAHSDDLPGGLVPPVFEYETHAGGTCAITGGYVYRGSAIPGLVGAYLYADFCVGDVRALRLAGGKVSQEVSLGVRAGSLASFGQDHQGELFVLSLSGEVFELVPG